MKCRNAGGSSSMTLACDAAGLSNKRIEALYASLTEEGEYLDAPSILDIEDWRSRQYFLLERADLSAMRKDSIRQRLNQSYQEPTPDGAEFYAWQHIEARARQERALYSVEGVVDLSPAGEHEHKYQLGEDGRPEYVWYASYGSNLNENRLKTYIEGGRPPGGSRTYSGCTDTTLPIADIPIRVHGFRPHFALRSGIWGGGIAFIDEADDDSAFLGRAYLISIKQYDEIVAQENGSSAKFAKPVDLTETLAFGRDTRGMGAYETNLHLGDYRGAPVLSFTAPFGVQDALGSTGVVQRTGHGVGTASTNKPSAAYCRMIGSGLHETFGMTEVAQADYIRGCPGGDQWERRDLVRALRAPEPIAAASKATTTSFTTTRAKGDLYPPVRDYESREDQRSGVARWNQTVGKARKALAAEERSLASLTAEGPASKKSIAEKQKLVADSMKAVKEAETKRDKAKAQVPKEWFKGRHARTRRDWKQFADDLHADIGKTQKKFQKATPGTKQAGNLAIKIDDLKQQHREAVRKSEPAPVPTKDNWPSSWVGKSATAGSLSTSTADKPGPVFPSGTSTLADDETDNLLPGFSTEQLSTRLFNT